MRDLLYPDDNGWRGGEDAVARARSSLQRPLPKRFYTTVAVEPGTDGFLVTLDGRKARTPAKNLLALPNRAAAEIVASEWEAQRAVIDPADMHATRIANIGIDRVDAVRDDVLAELERYAASDVVLFRADGPKALVAYESAAWDRVLDHARARHGARFVLSQGLGHAQQSPAALAAVKAAFARVTCPIALAALHTLTTIAGSALIPLALLDGALEAEEAFSASSIEEDWNARFWGADALAEERRARRRTEFLSAAALLAALTP